MRTPRSNVQDSRGPIPDMLSIHVRVAEIEDLQFPEHWEDVLIERPLPKAGSAVNMLQAFTAKLFSVATRRCDCALPITKAVKW
jgi:hypothetical protein